MARAAVRSLARGLLTLAAAGLGATAALGWWASEKPQWPEWTSRLPPQAQLWLAAIQPEPTWKQLPQGAWLDRIRQRGSLVVAVRSYQRPAPPDMPTPAEPDSFDARLAGFLAEKIGVKLQLVSLTPAASGPGYASPAEAVDLVVAGTAASPQANVPTSYTSGTAKLVVLRGSPIHSSADLRQRSVCLQRGSSHAQVLAEHYGALPHSYASGVHAVYAFMAGECEALAEDADLVERLAARPEWRFYRTLPQEVAPDSGRPQLLLAGGDAASVDFVDQAVRYWKTGGALLQAREQRVGDVSFELLQLENGLICHG